MESTFVIREISFDISFSDIIDLQRHFEPNTEKESLDVTKIKKRGEREEF